MKSILLFPTFLFVCLFGLVRRKKLPPYRVYLARHKEIHFYNSYLLYWTLASIFISWHFSYAGFLFIGIRFAWQIVIINQHDPDYLRHKLDMMELRNKYDLTKDEKPLVEN